MAIFNLNNTAGITKFSFNFAETLIENNFLDPVFLCVGNSNVVGDLFGPMCGEQLKKANKNLKVFGTLNDNVTSKNLLKTYNFIKQKHPLNPVVIIDSALGEEEEVGLVKLNNHGCLPAHKTNNIIMGNICVLGVVNAIGISDFMFLKTVKFNMVNSLSDHCAKAILQGLKLKEIYENSSNNLCV